MSIFFLITVVFTCDIVGNNNIVFVNSVEMDCLYGSAFMVKPIMCFAFLFFDMYKVNTIVTRSAAAGNCKLLL